MIRKSSEFPWLPTHQDGSFGLEDPVVGNGDGLDLGDLDGYIDSMIMGHTTEEAVGSMGPFVQNAALYANFTAMLPRLLFESRSKSEAAKCDLEKHLIDILKKYKNQNRSQHLFTTFSSIFRMYLKEGKINRANVRHAIRLISDFTQNGQMALTAKAILQSQKIKSKIFYYQFGYSGSNSLCDVLVYPGWRFAVKLQLHNFGIGKLLNKSERVNAVNACTGYNMRNGYGVCHGDDLLFQFVLGDQPPPMNQGPLSWYDKAASDKLLTLWTNFAKTGNPNMPESITASKSVEEEREFIWQPLSLDTLQ